MKIGILTLPLHTNYGGILQAWALQTVLERMGHEVEVIDKSRYRYLPWYKAIIKVPIRLIRKFLLRKKIGIFSERYYNKALDRDKVTQQYTRTFINKHIKQRHIEIFSEINSSDYDAIVVGSDQIWRTRYAKMFLQSTPAAFLDFAKGWDIKRIAYAASFGTNEWEYSEEDTKRCSKLIHKFDAVSVRENSGVDVCSKHLLCDKAVHVIDPTMLLDAEDYHSLFVGKVKKSPGNLMCYILDETSEIAKLIENISKAKNLTPFRTNSKVDDWSAPIEERIQPPVEKWLQGFMDSEFVVTDSFHACVFSILFRKQFYVVANSRRGSSRFESLLSTFGLQDRLVNEFDQVDLNKTIDYDYVYSVLRAKREEAISFLQKYL